MCSRDTPSSLGPVPIRIRTFEEMSTPGHSGGPPHRWHSEPCVTDGRYAVTLATNPARFVTVRWIFCSRVRDSGSRAPAPASFLPRT
jgi:hypothetical protein